MIGAIATATEMQNNFGRYLSIVMGGDEVIVTKNGKEVGRFIPKDTALSYLTDSLTGVLKGQYDIDDAREADLMDDSEKQQATIRLLAELSRGVDSLRQDGALTIEEAFEGLEV